MAKRTVLVTGAGSGIGKATAELLAERGWRVAVNDIDFALAQSVASNISGIAAPGDISKPADRALIIDGVGHELAGLVNNAGIVSRGPLAEVEAAGVRRTFEVNVESMISLSQLALPLLEQSRGSIVNIASIAVFLPALGAGAYTASKAAVVAVTEQAAAEWGPLGIRVNAIAPGTIRTPMTEARFASGAAEQLERSSPMRRYGMPIDIARVVSFLLSDDASFVNGALIRVDGGYVPSRLGAD